MKKQNHFDSFINEKLGDVNLPVPSSVWEAIAENQNKKRRAGFWWKFSFSVFVTLVIFTAGIAYRYYNSDSKQISGTNLTESNNAIILKQEDDGLSNQNSKINTINAPIESNEFSVSGPAINEETNRNQKEKEQIQNEKANESVQLQSVIENDGMKNERKRHLSSRKKSIIHAGAANDFSDDLTQDVRGEDETVIDKEYQQITSDPNQVQVQLDRTMESIRSNKKRHLYNFSKLIAVKQNKLFQKETIPCPKPEVAAKKSSLEFYAGTDFLLRKFTDTSNTSYLNQRKETQTFKSAFQIGVRYNRSIGRGFSLSGGIQYNQINERFRHTQGNIINYTYVIDASGDTVQTIQTISARYKQITNRYRMFELPFMIGYDLRSENIGVRFNAGVMLNVHSFYKGEVLDKQSIPVSIANTEPVGVYQMNRSLGLSFVCGASIFYAIQGEKYLFVEPHFQYRTKNTTQQQLSLKQRDHLWGIRAGLKLPLSF
ncbi:MAG: hypothetical protein RL582_1011 [Bacteroidota bacterium]|jgi:hypothetical protein